MRGGANAGRTVCRILVEFTSRIHVRCSQHMKNEKFSFATLLAARMTGSAVPDTAPPAPTLECRLGAPGTPWGDAAPRGFTIDVTR